MKHVITGSDLKSLREKLGLKQAYVADYIGVSRQTLGNWENEIGDPSSVKFLKLLGYPNYLKILASELSQRFQDKAHLRRNVVTFRASVTPY